MTSLSQWLAAEQADKTEPAGFYIPGAVNWEQRQYRIRRGRAPLRFVPEKEEVGESNLRWSDDE